MENYQGNVVLSQTPPHLFDVDGDPYDFTLWVGKGWEDLCIKTFGRIADAYVENGVSLSRVYLHDIKEKFGGLRIYLDGGCKGVDEIIEEAEKESFTICEICGDKGRPRKGGWILTLCDKHAGWQQQYVMN